jgi:hypothetical protein
VQVFRLDAQFSGDGLEQRFRGIIQGQENLADTQKDG